jgi:hypothetical protein
MNKISLKCFPKDITLPYLFCTNVKTTHNKKMFENIDVETFTFVTWNVHYDVCFSFYIINNFKQNN